MVIGGGPTGVEVAGTIAEISARTMREDYEHVDLDLLEIILVEGQPRILNTYHESLSERAARDLEQMGVKVMRNSMVTDVNEKGVRIKVTGDASGNGQSSDSREVFIETGTVIRGAGNAASPLLRTLGVPLEKDGRLRVDADLSVPGHPDIFVIGFRNRFRVMAEWFWFYLTFRGGSRLITRKRMEPEQALQDQE